MYATATIALDSAALSWKREAISKTLPLLYLRIHCEYDCETWNGCIECPDSS